MRISLNGFSLTSQLTDPHPAEASGVMSLRKEEGPLGTVDLPVPEAIPERPEAVCSLR